MGSKGTAAVALRNQYSERSSATRALAMNSRIHAACPHLDV
jgi:hypothetical protein